MWNFSFVIPSLLILSIILVFYFTRPRLSINRNRLFVRIVLVESLTIIFDILSSIADNNYTSVPVWLLHFLNIAFFVLFFFRFLILYVFTINILRFPLESTRVIKYAFRLPCYYGVLMTVLSPLTGAVYYIDGSGYHSGPMYDLLYFSGLFYVLLSLFSTYLFRRHLYRRREKYSMILCNAIILIGMIVRYLFPTHLLMDTFVLMAIIVVFLTFINPEFYLDLRSSLFNSRALREYLEENTGGQDLRSIGVIVHNYNEMLDIYGEQQMDDGLYMIGRYLTGLIPSGNIFYYKGGRFFIFLNDPDADFKDLCSTISGRFSFPWRSKGSELYLTAGFATIKLENISYSSDIITRTLVKSLETADSTGNDIPFEITEKELVQTAFETTIKRSVESAVENNSVEVFLQPLIDAGTNRISGAEALSRIRDPEGKIIPPGMFISIAESSGRINELGEQVFEKTVRFIKENDIESMGIKWINVNLSPMQFVRTDLADRYSTIIKKYGVDPGKIHLEITEESMVDNSFLNKQIQTMEEKGFKFVLDDYGTGYSNLSRLKKCPFINIKLDMSLVWDYCKDPDEILPTMIDAFRHMGFEITAEGIEDNAMADLMKKLSCDYLQGYYYSKPVPPDEFVKLCSSHAEE